MQATSRVERDIAAIQGEARRNVSRTGEASLAVDEAETLVKETGQVLEHITGLSEATAREIGSIAGASREQSLRHEEINGRMNEVTCIAEEIAAEMEQSSRAVEDLAGAARRLGELINSVRG